MKKIFTLMIALFALATGWAQEIDNTFQFTDMEGNPVADGAVITISTVNEAGQMIVPLMVKNISGEKAAVSMYETIDAIPNGMWQTCAFGNCMVLNGTGYSPKSIQPADYHQDIQTEWIPEEGQYGAWAATLQIQVFNIVRKMQFGQMMETAGDNIIGYGPKVTVQFVYEDLTSVNAVKANGGSTQHFNLRGQQVSSSHKGLHIVRKADGTIVKTFKK